MRLNVTDLLKRKVEVLSFDISYREDFLKRDDFKLKLKSPLKVSGIAYYDNEVINIKGNISGLVEAQCSRCLNYFNYLLNVDFDENFSKSQDNEEIYPVVEENIDLMEMIIDNLILSMPLKPLCSDDCKGLCSVCGKNLNEGKCDCENNNIDPRLAVLKDMFNGD